MPMSEQDIKDIKESSQASIKAVNQLINVIEATHKESFGAMEAFGKDMTAVKEQVKELHYTVNGNGKEGLKEKTARILAIIEQIKGNNDTNNTNNQLLDGRVKKIENRLSLWKGVFIGANTLWTIILGVLTFVVKFPHK